MAKSKIQTQIEEKAPISLSEFLEEFPVNERKSIELEVFDLASEDEIEMKQIESSGRNPDYMLKRKITGSHTQENQGEMTSNTKFWMFKFSLSSQYDEVLGDHYELPDGIANAREVKEGDKTIWFETRNDRIKIWGHGEVKEVSEKNGKKYAFFEKFEYFGNNGEIMHMPTSENEAVYKIPENIEDKVKKSGRWNPRNAIISIPSEIYLTLIGKGDVFEDSNIIIPKKEDIERLIKERIEPELLIEKKVVFEIINHIASGRHVLLAGSVGTGKTRLAMKIASLFCTSEDEGYFIEEHTATSEWTTFDVIGGIVPKMKDDEKAVYDIHYGCVVDTVRKNWDDDINGGLRKTIFEDGEKFRGTWLLIDEFNRADIDKAFGQMFTALRSLSLKIPTKTPGKHYQQIKVPKDYRIIGTLNTVDKNFLFDLSDALKSRFAFVEIDIPNDEMYQREIFYAAKNAKDELGREFGFLNIDTDNKKIDTIGTEVEFYHSMLNAYYFLRTVRKFKRLGTAILKLVYQFMIVRREITGKNEELLSPSIISIILPQLETLTGSEIKTISAIHSEQFKEKVVAFYEDRNRNSFVDPIEKVLDLLGLESEYKEKFSTHSLSQEDIGKINNARDNEAQKFFALPSDLKEAMDDLAESSVI